MHGCALSVEHIKHFSISPGSSLLHYTLSHKYQKARFHNTWRVPPFKPQNNIEIYLLPSPLRYALPPKIQMSSWNESSAVQTTTTLATCCSPRLLRARNMFTSYFPKTQKTGSLLDMERFGRPEHNRDKLYVLLPPSLSRKSNRQPSFLRNPKVCTSHHMERCGGPNNSNTSSMLSFSSLLGNKRPTSSSMNTETTCVLQHDEVRWSKQQQQYDMLSSSSFPGKQSQSIPAFQNSK